jgi:2-polyprenyl-3-methyl-5-hydroxy-6-metoxy-1,4-benzoquinol methylase
MDNATLERIVPGKLNAEDEFETASLQLHVDRYKFATKYLKPGRILDIACGVGYGARFVLENCVDSIDQLLAVDISGEAIDYAREHYSHPKIIYQVADALQFSDSGKFNTIISLETLEHLVDPSAFIKNISLLLKPGGNLIISAPITPSTDGNPFHLHNFTANSFRKLFAKEGLKEIGSLLQVQPYSLSEIFFHNHDRKRKIRRNLFSYYLLHPNMIWLRLRSLIVDGMTNKYMILALAKL